MIKQSDGIVINNNDKEHEEYMFRREMIFRQAEMRKEIEELRSELSKLKSIIRKQLTE